MALLLEELTRQVIGRFYVVYNRLGYGLLENGYVGAFELELRKAGLKVAREVPVAVEYDFTVVGHYRIDLLIDDCLIVEVKTGTRILEEHEAQLRNYLKCSRHEVGLLFLFGPRPQFRRLIFTNEWKNTRLSDPWVPPPHP